MEASTAGRLVSGEGIQSPCRLPAGIGKYPASTNTEAIDGAALDAVRGIHAGRRVHVLCRTRDGLSPLDPHRGVLRVRAAHRWRPGTGPSPVDRDPG